MLAISGTEADLDRDVEQTGTPDTMVAHPTSSVYGAGAAGPAMISGRDTATRVDYSEPLLAQARDTHKQDSLDPSIY